MASWRSATQPMSSPTVSNQIAAAIATTTRTAPTIAHCRRLDTSTGWPFRATHVDARQKWDRRSCWRSSDSGGPCRWDANAINVETQADVDCVSRLRLVRPHRRHSRPRRTDHGSQRSRRQPVHLRCTRCRPAQAHPACFHRHAGLRSRWSRRTGCPRVDATASCQVLTSLRSVRRSPSFTRTGTRSPVRCTCILRSDLASTTVAGVGPSSTGACASAISPRSGSRQGGRKFQFAALCAGALGGGLKFDVLEEVYWWRTDDFWRYALFATGAIIRARAEARSDGRTAGGRARPRSRLSGPAGGPDAGRGGTDRLRTENDLWPGRMGPGQ